jgi:hypothetical protein
MENARSASAKQAWRGAPKWMAMSGFLPASLVARLHASPNRH